MVKKHVLGESCHPKVLSFHEWIDTGVALIHINDLPLFPSRRADDLYLIIGGVSAACLVETEAELFSLVGPIFLLEVEDVGVEVGVADVGTVEGTVDVLSGGAGTSMYYS